MLKTSDIMILKEKINVLGTNNIDEILIELTNEMYEDMFNSRDVIEHISYINEVFGLELTKTKYLSFLKSSRKELYNKYIVGKEELFNCSIKKSKANIILEPFRLNVVDLNCNMEKEYKEIEELLSIKNRIEKEKKDLERYNNLIKTGYLSLFLFFLIILFYFF